MEKKTLGFKLLTLALAFTCQTALWAAPQTEVAHFHFLGGNQMVANPAMAKFKEFATMTNTPAFRASVARGVANVLAASFGRQINPANTNAPGLLAPLVADVFQSETVATFGGASNQPLGFAMAVHLNDAQAKSWQDAFARLVALTPETATLETFPAQVWKKASLRVIRAKDWVVVSRGEDLQPRVTQYLQSIKQTGRPQAALQGIWFSADADWPRLGAWLPMEKSVFKPAAMELTIGPKGEYQKSVLKLHYAQPINWKAQPWHVPAETIRDPLVSFTAMQNVEPFLVSSENLNKLKVNPLSRPMFVWALDSLPFRNYIAYQVNAADGVFSDLAAQVPTVFNPELKRFSRGYFALSSNRSEIVWEALPFMNPIVEVRKEKAGEFIFASFAPPPRRFVAAPTELYAQLYSRSNIIYYDWEITGARLQQWRTLVGILPLELNKTRHSRASSGAALKNKSQSHATPIVTPSKTGIPREDWLTEITPLLGNSITEARLAGPNDVIVERNSYIGFTGVELVFLSQWLDANVAQISPTLSAPTIVVPKK